MKKIKLTFPYPNFPLVKQTQDNQGRWNDYQFFINEETGEYDYWVVFESLLKKTETTLCPKENTIFISAEPNSVNDYNPAFLRQFAKIITCQTEIKHPGATYNLQGQPWHIGLKHSQHGKFDTNKSYKELSALTAVPKTKKLSLIVSNKQFTSGHKKRYAFALALKKYFGSEIDLFGRGINDFDDKWSVLAPYKYSIAIENSNYDNYITEKLFDCYLSHVFPFYNGAPNVSQYFSPEACEVIDVDNLDGTIHAIKSILNNPNHYQAHLPAILEAKNLCLNKYNLFPLIVDFIEANGLLASAPKQNIKLKQYFFSPSRGVRRVFKKIKQCYVQNL